MPIAAAGSAREGVGTLAPGQSAIFVEGTAAKADALKATWFGSSVPAGFLILTDGAYPLVVGKGKNAQRVRVVIR